jgi:Spy/CpxP family protein refolding chaperone
MRKTLLAAAALLLIILPSAAARADENVPPPIALTAHFLQLSSDQVQALVSMIQTRETALRPIAEKLQADREALGKLVESANPDAAAVGRLLLSIHAAEVQANEVGRGAAAAFEEVLTPEQRGRLQLLRQAAQVEPAIPAFRAVGLL